MKRYAIVRVDNGQCPSHFETPTKFGFGLDERWCVSNEKGVDCKNCRYGDTKEQLIRKIAQALRKSMPIIGITKEELAKEIVKFLGVE